jgi:WD40 repeat protein
VVFSPHGKTVATSALDGTVRLWTINGQQFAEYRGTDGVFSPDGKLIAIATDDNTIQLRPVEGLDELLTRACRWLEDYYTTHPDKENVCKGVL